MGEPNLLHKRAELRVLLCILATSLDVLDVLQLMLDRTAVPADTILTPGHHRSVAQNCSESPGGGRNLLHSLPQLLSRDPRQVKLSLKPQTGPKP